METLNIPTAYEFILNAKCTTPKRGLIAVSLFSGGGISDLGYQEAGFKFVAQLEIDEHRAKICQKNFPESKVFVGDIKKKRSQLIEFLSGSDLDLISLTPPCQGMSSSNPGRGKASNPHTSDARNTLLLDALPVLERLTPKVIVVENVPQLFNRMVKYRKKSGKLLDIFLDGISKKYTVFTRVVQMADYGVPQDRKRAVLVAIRNDQAVLPSLKADSSLAFPLPTHGKKGNGELASWISLSNWLNLINYSPLDAISKESAVDKSDTLHQVPYYSGDRYLMVADIPKNSGKNAYQNSVCHRCGKKDVPEGKIYCTNCRAPLITRPYVKTKGKYRLIKGFASSYRRMYPDRPSATITTASSHIGSDYKIHPWENRVLSMRECADIQTVPRKYDFALAFEMDRKYLIRQIIGESLPPWFTYQHGILLSGWLALKPSRK